MSGNTIQWIVKSYHINVAVGDCAIHLLLGPATNSRLYSVHAAILVDGGTDRSRNPNLQSFNALAKVTTPLLHMIDKINSDSSYQWVNAEKRLVFDSIIVTHWDEDHYGGLSASFAMSLNKDYTIPYLRYEDGDYQKPRTYLYAPNIVGDGTVRYNGMSPKWTCEGYDQPIFFAKTGIPFALFRYCKDDTGVGVIGANFLNNTVLRNPATGSTVSKLIQSNPPSSNADGRPGIYCVGVRQTSFPSGLPMIIQENPTVTNKVSIAAMIIWPTNKDPSVPPRISHYFAGDMDEQSESKVLDWLVLSGVESVGTVKLSHHGSRSSTPLRLFQVMKPTNIIISNPKGKYFHPSKYTVSYDALNTG